MTNLHGHETEYSAINKTTPFGISAGGVVYRKQDEDYEFLLLGKKDEGESTYHLPKGTLHIDETLEQCALREIAEEAGVLVELKMYIGARAEEQQNGAYFYRKTNHYYVAEYRNDTDAMDDEHDFREWCEFDDAIGKLSTNIKQENVFVERANDYLKNLQ